MCPPRPASNAAESYDLSLQYARHQSLLEGHSRPQPTQFWPKENIEFLERYRDWLLGGGVSEMVINTYHLNMAGHVLGLTLKPHPELDPDQDLDCALEYVQARQLGPSWIKACRNSLRQFRRFLRLQRGLGEESKFKAFDVPAHTQGLPVWLLSELERYQKVQQRNWRSARVEQNVHRFWCGYLRTWRFLVEQRGVQRFEDLKRQHILDYIDLRLEQGHSPNGVNADLRYLHTFLLFLQEEGYTVHNSLLRIPGLKLPEPLPKYLTDEQVMKLRDEFERAVREAKLGSKRRIALLDRAAFYLLWQGGLRLGELEELRLEDLDLGQKRLSVRDSKLRKDRTVYLADSAIHALEAYLAVRGEGSGDQVFLYRNAPVKKDLIHAHLKYAGERVGVKVYPHRLRHTCATQLLNAGCRITSIQRFLGHKKLNTTMIYARAYDQTVADDYFAAMRRIERRLEIAPEPSQETNDKVVKVHERIRALQLTEQLVLPELCLEERLNIASQLREWFGLEPAHSPPAAHV